MDSFILLVLSLVLISIVYSKETVLETTLVQCSNDDALSIGSGKNPVRLASSFKGHTNFELRLYTKCRKKLLMTLRVTDTAEDFISDEIVIVNHAKNSFTKKFSSLGLPITIKFHQDKVFQKYPLKYLYRVNAKMMEEVINSEKNKSYSGCDNSPESKSPTCGFYPSTGSQVAGFCCSCKDHRNNMQQRGGHRCDVPGSTPEQLTSAHCLRPSPFYYKVYELQPPTLYQRLSFEVFRSELLHNGNLTWHRMSDSKLGVQVDTENTVGASGSLQVALLPHLAGLAQSASVFNYTSQRLLHPVPHPFKDSNQLPDPLKGPPDNQMLIVSKTLMSPHGALCDRVGTGLNAFLHQKEPCRQSGFSCLKNQPFDLWKMDQGPRGAPSAKYRLSSHRSSLDDIPPFADFDRDYKSGVLYVEHKHITPFKVNIEIPADDLVILAPGYNAFIESVLTDTGMEGAKVVTQIMNKELTAASFSVELVECSVEIMDDNGGKVASPMQKIGPLGAKHFYLDIHSFKISQRVFCFLLLVNEHKESIAAREIILHPQQTCLCVHTCKCACGNKTNVKCEQLSDDNIIAAGLYFEVKTSDEIATEDQENSKQRMKWTFFLILAIHAILLGVAAIIWIRRKGSSKKEHDEGKENKDGDSVFSSDESGGSGNEEETEEELNTTRSSEGSEVTLYKKKAQKKPVEKLHGTKETCIQTQHTDNHTDHNAIGNNKKEQSTKKPTIKPAASLIDVGKRASNISMKKSTGSTNIFASTSPERTQNQPAPSNHSRVNFQNEVESGQPKIKSGGKENEKGGLCAMTPSFNWEHVNNNVSSTENNIDSFFNFCASTSSSKTSFGTYNRRKRDQYSAYDFLPESKRRGSITWED